ncbi:MAG: diheme cytochrome c [Gammaproteobacteria bacterium]|nr:diheme cytochrome c [Gammaproteobacteria bacterium]
MKQNRNMMAGSILMTAILAFSLYGFGQIWASSKNQANPLYAEECGSCHMAYPAQLLPPQSWQNMMLQLEDHFGENAELDAESKQAIESYLVEASQQGNGSSRKLFRNLGKQVPERITTLPYFIHEHDEIPSRLITSNDKVGSLSQCNACHQRAEQGDFDEDDVSIPGFGRWDD